MSVQIFATEAEATQVAQAMTGWEIEIVSWTDLQGQAGWVIQAQAPGATGQPTYLHDDGIVR